jgi:hypothetical protein
VVELSIRQPGKVQQHAIDESALDLAKEVAGRPIQELDALWRPGVELLPQAECHVEPGHFSRERVVDAPELITHVPDVTLQEFFGRSIALRHGRRIRWTAISGLPGRA